MPRSDLAISVRGLSKAYTIAHNAPKHTTAAEALIHRLKHPFARVEKETFWALKEVDFDIQQGDIVGIIGRNGAGKSTLLKILSRITPPTTGQIDLYGRVGSLLEVGTGFHPELTGRENIFLNGAILGMSKGEITRLFDEIVDFAGMEQFLDTPVKRYSSGMYVRLAFAVAAHLNPEILIIDEVLAVGDAAFQRKCINRIASLATEGRTILFVSHNIETIQRLCRSTIFLKEGKAVQFPNVEEGITHYLGSATQSNDIDLTRIERLQTARGAQPLFQRLRISSHETPTTSIAVGDSLTLELTLGNMAAAQDAMCSIVFLNQNYQRIVMFHSTYQSNVVLNGGEDMVLVCHIESLLLTPGSYIVELNIGNGNQLLDKIDAATQIEVIFADLFGTGRLPNSTQGQVILSARWEVQPAAGEE